MAGSEEYNEPPPELDDVPQHKIAASSEAERCVLGAIINREIAERGEAVATVSGMLRPEHFYFPAHRTIYTAILSLYERGEPADEVSVIAELERTDKLNSAGGIKGVLDIGGLVFTDANAERHARIVLEKSALRTITSIGHELASRAQNGPGDISALIASANEQLLSAHSQGDRSIVSACDVAIRVTDRIDAYSRGDTSAIIKTPFLDLNKIVTGFRPSEYFVIAARPGMGKSALSHILALHASTQLSVPVGIITLEMSKEEVVERMACTMARADSKELRENTISHSSRGSVATALETIAGLSIYFDESHETDPLRLRNTIRRMKQRHGIKMVILDHIQLVSGPKRSENRQQEVTAISRSCKIAAKESDVALIVLSQLNRRTENTGDGRPNLADLRESGSIEQDADSVLFIYNKWKYKKESLRNQSEFIVAKQRNGPQDESCFIEWTAKYTRFDDWIPGESDRRVI